MRHSTPTSFSGLRWIVAFSALLPLVPAEPAVAHDFWIAPESFRPLPDRPLFLWLEVGDDFRGEAVDYLPSRVHGFWALDSDGERVPLVPSPGSGPAGILRPGSAGGLEIAYLSRPEPLVLDAERFATYVAEEGIEVEELPLPGARVRERFARCAKSLVGVAPPVGGRAPLGLPLELVLDSRGPAEVTESSSVAVRILLRGRPLTGVRIGARSRESGPWIHRVSDAEGRVDLPLGVGRWLVKAVHLEPAAPGSGADVDSWWASLTFEIEAD